MTAYPTLNQANCLTFAPNDPLTLWAGTAAGVVRWDLRTDTPTLSTTADGLAANWVNDLRFAPDGTLWAATLKGLSHYDGQRWVIPSGAEGMPVIPIYSLAFAPDGSLWVGARSREPLTMMGNIGRTTSHRMAWPMRRSGVWG